MMRRRPADEPPREVVLCETCAKPMVPHCETGSYAGRCGWLKCSHPMCGEIVDRLKGRRTPGHRNTA